MNITNILPNLSEYFGVIAFVGLLVFSLTLYNPRIGLGLLIFSIILSPEIQFSDKYLRIDDILLVVILLGWIASMATKGKGFLANNLNIPILLYLILNLLSMVNGFVFGNFSPSYHTYRPIDYSILTFLKKVEYFCIFFAAVNSIKNVRQIKVFIILLLATCLLADIYAITQTLSSPAGMETRVTAPFDPESNTFGQYLLLHIVILTSLVFSNLSLPQKIPLAALLLLSCFAFTFTYSRGSYFALIASLIFLGLIWNKKIIVIMFVIIILATAILPDAVINRVQSGFQEIQDYREGKADVGGNSFLVRVNSFKEGFSVALQNPLLGAGLGLMSMSQIESQFPREAYETGFIGLFIFLWILFAAFKTCYLTAKKSSDSYLKALSTGTMAVIVGYTISSFSAVPFTTIRTAEPFWLLIALVVVANNLSHYHKTSNLNFVTPEKIKSKKYIIKKTHSVA